MSAADASRLNKPYQRSKWVKGSPEHVHLALESRFVPEPMSGCSLWIGSLDREGYGRINLGGASGGYQAAHRVAYELECGEIEPGLVIDHLCRVRCCVNPAHLEPVSSRTNTLRGETLPAVNASKERCSKGHLLSGSNLYSYKNRRFCRACNTFNSKSYKHRKAAAENGARS